jgi:hypothetical protein
MPNLRYRQLKEKCEALGLKVFQSGPRPAKEDCYAEFDGVTTLSRRNAPTPPRTYTHCERAYRE